MSPRPLKKPMLALFTICPRNFKPTVERVATSCPVARSNVWQLPVHWFATRKFCSLMRQLRPLIQRVRKLYRMRSTSKFQSNLLQLTTVGLAMDVPSFWLRTDSPRWSTPIKLPSSTAAALSRLASTTSSLRRRAPTTVWSTVNSNFCAIFSPIKTQHIKLVSRLAFCSIKIVN